MLPLNLKNNIKIIIICGVALFCGATSFTLLAQTDTSPKLKPKLRQGTTKELVIELEKQSGWVISYSSRLCTKSNIQLHNETKSLVEHLNQIFKDCPFSYIIRDNRIILKPIDKKELTYSVRGFVRDSTNKESLPSATIYATQTQSGTSSNNYGFFNITLPYGENSLRSTFVGYAPQEKSFFITNDTVINFNLTPALELQEVFVIGTQISEQIQQTRMGSTILPINEIRKAPSLLGESDLVKNIQMLPGVQGGSEGFSGLYVRGGGPDQNLILLDDVPVYNIGHLLGFFSIFNADAVRHVTVLKGGFPARYGGRLSSVIDIRMLEGNNEEFNGTLNLGILSSGLSINGPVKKNKSAFALSFRRSYIDGIAALVQSGSDETTNFYFFDFNAKFNYNFNDRSKLFFSTYWGRDKYYTTYNYQERLTDNEPSNQLNSNQINDENNAGWGNFVNAMRWNFLITPRLFSNVTATYSDYRFFIGVKRKNKTNNNWDSFEQRYLSGIQDLNLKIDFDYYPTNNHLIKFGVSSIRHEFNPGIDVIQRDLSLYQPMDTTIGNIKLIGGEYHLYAENEFTLSNNIRANVGARVVAFKGDQKIYKKFEPRLAISIPVRSNLFVKSSYSAMSQYIHMVGSSNVALPTDLWLPVTDRLPPMHTHQITMGADWYPYILANYSFSIELYKKRFKNLLHYRESTGFFDYSTQWEEKLTSGTADSQGMELLLRRNRGNLTGALAYTFAYTTNKFEDLNNGKPFPARFDRRHDVNLNVNYQFNPKVDGSILWQYGSGTPVTLPSEKYYSPEFPFGENNSNTRYSENAAAINAFRIPAFHRLDIGFNFKKQKIKTERIWSVGVINIYARKNPFLLYFAADTESEPGTATRQLKQLSLFPLPIPYLKYTLKF